VPWLMVTGDHKQEFRDISLLESFACLQLSITFHYAQSTKFQIPGSRHPALNTQHYALSTKHKVPGSKFQVSNSKSQVPSTQH